MSTLHVIAGVLAIAVAIYLCVALFYPERLQ